MTASGVRILLVALGALLAVAGPLAADEPVIVALGDSLTAGFGLLPEDAYPTLLEQRLRREGYHYRVVNAGVSGDTTAAGLRRVDWVLRSRPAVVIVALGANDGLRHQSVAAMRDNLVEIVKRLRAAGAGVLLAGMRVPPNYGAEFAQAYEAVFTDLAKAHKIALAPDLMAGFGERLEFFLPDRIHPNESAQPAVLDNVWKALRPLLK